MNKKWTQDELLKFEALCGDRPWKLVVEAYNSWARQNNMPERTSLALERKAQQLGVYRRSEGTWITIGTVSEILELDRATPLRWVKQGVLRAWRNGNSRSYPHYVNRDDLRQLVKVNPCFFRCYRREQLVMLFDSEHFADMVTELCPVPCTTKGRSRRVLCVETGKRYDSINRAALAVYVTAGRLRTVLDTHHTAAGYHWKSMDPPVLAHWCATLDAVEDSSTPHQPLKLSCQNESTSLSSSTGSTPSTGASSVLTSR